jgi:5'-nucleotidase
VIRLCRTVTSSPPVRFAIAESHDAKENNEMRILITNDDGIEAPGLAVLHDIAAEIAGGAENVYTVAPAYEQSGVAHCISYTDPMKIAQFSDNKYSIEGSPADCVMAGLYEVLADRKPDLVLSGVNRGNNTSQNTMYSGTLGAAIEGAMHNVRSIALSQFMGPGCPTEDRFAAARAHGADIVRTLLDKAPWAADPYHLFYNVNFPPVAADEVRGARSVVQGYRETIPFSTQSQVAPNGRKFLWITGGPQHHATAPGSDTHANLDGYIAITPMRADLTAYDHLDSLKGVFPE